MRESLGSLAPAPVEIDVLIHAPLSHVEATIGQWARSEAVDDTTTRSLIMSDGYDWALFALGVVEADFTVMSPPGFAEHARSWGDRFVRAAEGGAGASRRLSGEGE